MTSQKKVVISYAVWATICAAVAVGAATLVDVLFIHPSLRDSAVPGQLRAWAIDAGAGVGLQGIVTLVTGSVLVLGGRTLRYTVLLGLAIGLFDFALVMLLNLVAAANPGYLPTLVILAAGAAAITLLGQGAAAAPEP